MSAAGRPISWGRRAGATRARRSAHVQIGRAGRERRVVDESPLRQRGDTPRGRSDTGLVFRGGSLRSRERLGSADAGFRPDRTRMRGEGVYPQKSSHSRLSRACAVTRSGSEATRSRGRRPAKNREVLSKKVAGCAGTR